MFSGIGAGPGEERVKYAHGAGAYVQVPGLSPRLCNSFGVTIFRLIQLKYKIATMKKIYYFIVAIFRKLPNRKIVILMRVNQTRRQPVPLAYTSGSIRAVRPAISSIGKENTTALASVCGPAFSIIARIISGRSDFLVAI